MFKDFSISEFNLPVFGTQSVSMVIATLVFILLSWKFANKGSRLPLPPGPPTKPIAGNYFDLPKNEDWFLPDTYRDMAKSFDSPLITLKLFGVKAVIVNTAEAAKELFQARSHIYSGRPDLNLMHNFSRMDWFIAIMQPDEHWKLSRKTMIMNYKQNNYRDVSTRSAHTMMRALLTTPENFLDHFRRMNTATTLAVTYGIDMDDGDKGDHFVDISRGMMRAFADGTTSTSLAFDSLPAFVAEWATWLLGLRYKTDFGHEVEVLPFEEVKRQIAVGTAKPSIVANMLSKAQTKKDEYMAKITGANIYVSGSNMATAPLGAFVRAMVAYPEVQRRAQMEIDAVLGGSRLPTFSDAPSLPYIDAIVKEIFRWHLVAPFAASHRATQDDIYNGYLIPKGTLVFGNAWAILHDEKEYPEPNKFKPERWFDRPAGDFPFAGFGFGQRICPGIPFSRDMMWITIASMLAAFDIELADGAAVLPDNENWTKTLFSYTKPFKANITPRSPTARELVLATVADEPLTSM